MEIDIVIIRSKDMKFDEITVTCQLKNPSMPTIVHAAIKQQLNGSMTQRSLLKNKVSARIRNPITPVPNTIRSCSINWIISDVIMEIPPKYILASPE